MAVTSGTVIQKDGKYLLDISGKTKEISLNAISSPDILKTMVGKKVEVTMSAGANSFPVDIALPAASSAGAIPSKKVVVVKRVRITCYLPREDMLGKIGVIDRTKILDTLKAKNIIDAKVFEAIR